MIELVALKTLKYPRALKKGDRFSVDDRSAKVLTAARKAKPVRKRTAGEPSSGQLGLGEPGTYGRRDMRAQD